MPRLKPTTPNKIRAYWRKYPWLWGVTGRWFPGEDVVVEGELTAKVLSRFTWELGNHDFSYDVYRRVKDGAYGIDDVSEFVWHGEPGYHKHPVAEILRDNPGFLHLVEMKMSSATKYQRQFTIYKLPGSKKIRTLCAEALKIRAAREKRQGRR